MAATPTTKSQVQAYRFVLRRMEHALVRKDAVMLHDPMRTQVRATAVGLVLGILLLAGFALASVFRPADSIDDAAIVIGKGSGAIFVQRAGTFHPVVNLASARLVTGSTDAPTSVADNVIEGKPRGPLLGIFGAPGELPGARPAEVWTVCDTTTTDAALPEQARLEQAAVTTTVVAGELGEQARPLAVGQALYVQAEDGSTFLLYEGKRARIDGQDTALLVALDLAGQRPRTISSGLLNAVPEVAPIAAPEIPGDGGVPVGYDLAGLGVGEVVSVDRGSDTVFYVLLRNGVQEVPETVAAIIARGSEVRPVPATALGAELPFVTPTEGIAVADLPQARLQAVEVDEQPVACLRWDGTVADQPGDEPEQANARLDLLSAAVLPIPDAGQPVTLAQADEGSLLDYFYLPPGQAAVVRSNSPGQPVAVGTRYFISDVGVRYGVDDEGAARLGLGQTAPAAPESVLQLLPTGPELSVRAAETLHDGAPGVAPVAAEPATGG